MPGESLPKKLCSQCGQELPAGFGFCGACGAKLDTALLFSKDSRERRLLENDVAEAVVDRLVKWGKIAGGFVLASLAIAGLSLGVWGISSLKDLKTDLEGISAQTKAEAQGLKKQVESASSDVADLSKQSKALNGDLDHYRQVNRAIQHLQKDFQTINGQIANWYGLLETEVFDASSADRVRFIPLTLDQKKAAFASGGSTRRAELPFFTAVLTLKKTPIPASVRITRYNLSIPPADIKVAGRQVSFGTPSDKFSFDPADPAAHDAPGSPIYVQYHPAR